MTRVAEGFADKAAALLDSIDDDGTRGALDYVLAALISLTNEVQGMPLAVAKAADERHEPYESCGGYIGCSCGWPTRRGEYESQGFVSHAVADIIKGAS